MFNKIKSTVNKVVKNIADPENRKRRGKKVLAVSLVLLAASAAVLVSAYI